jgi:hypothetical protein
MIQNVFGREELDFTLSHRTGKEEIFVHLRHLMVTLRHPFPCLSLFVTFVYTAPTPHRR